MNKLLEHFRSGDVTIFPTDTLYAIGCVIDNPRALKKLSKIRKTPETKPNILLATDANQAFVYGHFGKNARKIARTFWPGPLTIVVKAQSVVSKKIAALDGTVAIRVPNQPPIQKILKELNTMIIAPSANFHNKPAPTRYDEIDKELIGLVDYAINISNLSSAQKMTGKPSTIISMVNDIIEIKRHGAISSQEVLKSQRGVSK